MSGSEERVVVIGGGASGIFCAHTLQEAGVSVTVLEADKRLGGRAINLSGFVNWKALDIGAEFIHGDETLLKKLVDNKGYPCRLLHTWAHGDGSLPDHPIGGGVSMYYLGKTKQLLRCDCAEPEVQRVNHVLWEVLPELDEQIQEERMSLGQWLKEQGIGETGLALAEAGYANTLCTSLSKLDLKSVIRLEKLWDEHDGHGDFRLENSMCQVFEDLAEGIDVKTNWPVKSIKYEQDKPISITSTTGDVIYASKVVVSVSLGVLKSGSIEFVPPLPHRKRVAIDTVEFENAIKIVLKFSKRFWPRECHGIICADCFIPEFWFDDPERIGSLTPASSPFMMKRLKKGQAPTYLVSAFACSKNAETVSSLSKAEIISRILKQLDEMFGSKSPSKLLQDPRVRGTPPEEPPNTPSPATQYFLDYFIQDWKKNPYVRGGYSSPSRGESVETRDHLAEPVDNRLFFIGEHTNRSYMSIHGAMETGKLAAERILKQRGNKPIPAKL